MSPSDMEMTSQLSPIKIEEMVKKGANKIVDELKSKIKTQQIKYAKRYPTPT